MAVRGPELASSRTWNGFVCISMFSIIFPSARCPETGISPLLLELPPLATTTKALHRARRPPLFCSSFGSNPSTNTAALTVHRRSPDPPAPAPAPTIKRTRSNANGRGQKTSARLYTAPQSSAAKASSTCTATTTSTTGEGFI